jgi:hypothetical protein
MVLKKAILSALTIIGAIGSVSALSPAPAPAPASSAPAVEHSVSTIVLIIFGIFGGITLVGTILFCFINRVHRYEEKKLPVRTDIPRFDKGLAFVSIV